MKNAMRIVQGLVPLLFLGNSAIAAEVWHTAYLKYVYPQANGSVVLVFTADSASCTSPNNPKYYSITVGQNSVTVDGLRAMHATALTAFAMERQVQFAFDNATANCYITRLLVLEQ